jgi:hypothetical protein
VPAGKDDFSSAVASIALTAVGGSREYYLSVGSLLQASPEIKFGGNFSSAPALPPGGYIARLQIKLKDGGAIFISDTRITLK